MAKIKQVIKPEASKRLKTLLKEQNLSQRQLSDIAGISQNTISKILNGKSPLTHTIAKLINKKFPEYRIEWIMAEDNDRTEEIHRLRPSGERLLRNHAKRKAIEQLFQYMDLEIELDVPEVEGSRTPLSELSDEEQDRIFGELISSAIKNNFDLKICDSDGNILARISREEYKSFTDEIADFFEFKLNKLCFR